MCLIDLHLIENDIGHLKQSLRDCNAKLSCEKTVEIERRQELLLMAEQVAVLEQLENNAASICTQVLLKPISDFV